MTPTEAATDAFMTVHAQGAHSTASPGLARYFLAALPPGWRLCGPDDVTVTVERLAAQLGEHRIGPGNRCMCGLFVHNGDTERLTRHVAAAILAALSTDKDGNPST